MSHNLILNSLQLETLFYLFFLVRDQYIFFKTDKYININKQIFFIYSLRFNNNEQKEKKKKNELNDTVNHLKKKKNFLFFFD